MLHYWEISPCHFLSPFASWRENDLYLSRQLSSFRGPPLHHLFIFIPTLSSLTFYNLSLFMFRITGSLITDKGEASGGSRHSLSDSPFLAMISDKDEKMWDKEVVINSLYHPDSSTINVCGRFFEFLSLMWFCVRGTAILINSLNCSSPKVHDLVSSSDSSWLEAFMEDDCSSISIFSSRRSSSYLRTPNSNLSELLLLVCISVSVVNFRYRVVFCCCLFAVLTSSAVDV